MLVLSSDGGRANMKSGGIALLKWEVEVEGKEGKAR